MPFDPNWPPTNAELESAPFRTQFNGLKALIDAGLLTGVVIDEVTTLPPGTPATATASMTGSVLHLSFGLPAGNDGNDGGEGPQGNDGNPGEVTNTALNEAIAGTARNPVGLSPLPTPYADPEKEELRQAHNALLEAIFRVPV